MDETYGTYVDDECCDIHDYDDDTDPDTDDDTDDDTDEDTNDDTDDDTDDGGRGNRRPFRVACQRNLHARAPAWAGLPAKSPCTRAGMGIPLTVHLQRVAPGGYLS